MNKENGVIFSLVVILLTVVGSRLQSWSLLPGLFLTEIFVVLLPVIAGLYWLWSKEERHFSVRQCTDRQFKGMQYTDRQITDIQCTDRQFTDIQYTDRQYSVRTGYKPLSLSNFTFLKFIFSYVSLKPTTILNAFVSVALIIFSIPLAGAINVSWYFLIKWILGKVLIINIDFPEGTVGFLQSILIIAILPAICEEFLFRGMMQRGFLKTKSGSGNVKPSFAIAFSAFLFGLIHLDFQKLPGTFFLGLLLGYLTYRSGSLLNGILGHFTNNFVVVILTYLTGLFQAANSSNINKAENKDLFNGFNSFDFGMYERMIKEAPVVFFAVWVVIILICATIAAGLLYSLTKLNKKPEKITGKPVTGLSSVYYLPGFILIVYIYLVQALSMLGIKSIFSDFARILIG